MNRQIVQLFGLSMLLFAVLVGFTSRWTVFEADELKDETANRRPLIEEQQIPRGLIRPPTARCSPAACPRGTGERRTFTRTYPTGPLFSHAVGYSFIERGRAGLERSRNDELTGEENEFATIFCELQVATARARTSPPRSTPRASARRSGAGRPARLGRGARAADRPGARDGQRARVRPEPGARPLRASSTATRTRRCSTAPPSRATRPARPSRWSPPPRRSTAASSRPTRSSTAPRRGTISGVPLANSGGQDFGPITLTDALTNSVNTVFAQVGEKIGAARSSTTWSASASARTRRSTIPTARCWPAASATRRGTSSAPTRLRRRARGHRPGRQRGPDPGEPAPDGDGRRRRGQRRRADAAAAHGAGGRQGRPREDVSPREQSRVMSRKAAGSSRR